MIESLTAYEALRLVELGQRSVSDAELGRIAHALGTTRARLIDGVGLDDASP